MIWTKKQLAEALSVPVNCRNAITGKVEFNSKNVNKGDLFIAMQGNRDGHQFVSDAIANGATAVIVSKEVDILPKDQDKVIKVTDTHVALEELANYKRVNSKAKFIAVTGSVGKTSTKESLRLMLASYGKVFASRGNFNNYLGLPLNLASIPDDTEYVVIELGMNHPGEIAKLTDMVRPDIAIITAIAEGHLEFFNSVAEIADAKSEIFNALDINNGIAILNCDSTSYDRCLQNIDKLNMQNVKIFGTKEEADVRFTSYELLDDNTVRLQYVINNEKIEISMNMVAERQAKNFAACFTAIIALDLEIEKAVTAITKFKPQTGRGNIVEIDKTGHKYSIICDYYNSNPESLKAALQNLAIIPANKKAVILGDMGELGKDAIKLHQAMIPYIIDAQAKTVILIGELMSNIISLLPKDINIYHYPDTQSLLKELDKIIVDEELILIKGSRFVGLEKAAEHLGVVNVL